MKMIYFLYLSAENQISQMNLINIKQTNNIKWQLSNSFAHNMVEIQLMHQNAVNHL